MAMPKGKKFNNGYCSVATFPSSKNYRQIAKICTEQGMKIGPSNVRNVLLSAMQKIAKPICEANSICMNDKQIMEIAKNPHFQMGIASIIQEDLKK